MSYDLINRSTAICRRFSRQSWVKALELARLYGWQPLGTKPPALIDFQEMGAEWSGTYLTNEGQVVKAEDARSLAAALERALADIPDTRPSIDWRPNFWLEDDLPDWLSPFERAIVEETLQDGLLDIIGMRPLDFFAGEEKQSLAVCIRFCRLGSFEIL